MTFFDKVLDIFTMYVLVPCLVLMGLFMLIGIPYILYGEYQQAKSPSIDLKKNEWTCTQTYIYYTHLKGIRYRHEACAEYQKDGALNGH